MASKGSFVLPIKKFAYRAEVDDKTKLTTRLIKSYQAAASNESVELADKGM